MSKKKHYTKKRINAVKLQIKRLESAVNIDADYDTISNLIDEIHAANDVVIDKIDKFLK